MFNLMKKGSGILLMLFIVACAGKKEAMLSLNAKNLEGEELTFANLNTNFYDTVGMSVESHPLEISSAQIVRLRTPEAIHQLYMTPDEDVSIVLDGKDISFSGPLAEENKYLQEIAELDLKIRKEYPLQKVANNPEDKFIEMLGEKYAGHDSLLTIINEDPLVDDYFKSIVEKRVRAADYSDRMYYERYYNYFAKDSVEMPDEFYAFIENLPLNDPDLLHFDQSRGYLRAVLDDNIEYVDGNGTYTKQLLAQVDEKITDPAVKDYLYYEYLNEKLNYMGGVEGIEDQYAAFMEKSDNGAIKGYLKTAFDQWVKLKAGMEAPDFTAYTREGEKVSMSDLKGKNVYVDVWATWCGPCIAEIPSLKSVEAAYHDKNVEFVSVSIDEEKDKEKWQKFIVDRELGGLQWMAEDAWKSEVATNYNIKGIPRFILIDDAGKLVSANAPRPSNDDLKDMLDGLNL